MRPKNMIFLSMGFVILGFILLFVGAGMLVASTNYPSSDSAGATILRVSGRIACISGGMLVAVTLCTCFYLCIIGAPYAVASEPYQTTRGDTSLWAKGGHPTCPKSILRQPTGHKMTTVNQHRWKSDEKDSVGDRPSRSSRTKTHAPGSDVHHEIGKGSRSCERSWKNTHNSLDLSSTVSWSNTVAGFPRLPHRRRRHSLDRTGEPFGHTSGIPMLLGAGDFNRMTTNRLWIPTLDNSVSATHGATDQISAELLGDCRMEPLGSMLHRGGHIKLGRPV
ncbi:hypothetical protein EG68_02133 [Paragonimus skrjabini miyazakii]|uniref:Transmembrane protein n=1 Tax=Paragonimus skrjabini miyazakii TaxID=59628 RepID=A0A8S9Z0D0_9TREM|nr:hypothetical protein EG68_02133 [Paragonimus skrjabini miyazakii]